MCIYLMFQYAYIYLCDITHTSCICLLKHINFLGRKRDVKLLTERYNKNMIPRNQFIARLSAMKMESTNMKRKFPKQQKRSYAP